MAQTQHFFNPASLAEAYHPGETLEEKLQEMAMSVKEFATRVSKPEKTIIAVIKGKSSVTPEMALAFELVTKIPANMWLNLQKNYDEYIARKKREKSLLEDMRWAQNFPIEEITRLGWFAAYSEKESADTDIVATLCRFFAVSSPKGWEDFYLNQRLRVAFRITIADACDPYALSAWLRQGEIQAAEITLENNYSSKLLRSVLTNIANLQSISSEADMRSSLSHILQGAGVKLIFTEPLSAAPVKGCTRYIYGAPCIQMSSIFDSHLDFWQTLFHEIGHILLHGKKDIFMENVNYGDKDPIKEQQAETFALQYLRR